MSHLTTQPPSGNLPDHSRQHAHAPSRPPSRGAAGAACALVILAAAALYLLGNGRMSLWDRDEPRYAQCSREMLQGSWGPADNPTAHRPPDWVVPQFLGAWRTAKPPLIYWAQMLAMRFLGDNSFAARLPSSLAILAILIILAVVLWRNAGPRRAFWTVFILASNVLTVMAAKMCITDAVLTLWITIAQLCLYAIWRGSRSWTVVGIFWVAISLAGLTKGPVVLAVILATMVVLAALEYAHSAPSLGLRRAQSSRTRGAGGGEQSASVDQGMPRSPGRRSQISDFRFQISNLRLTRLLRHIVIATLAGTIASARLWWLRTRPLAGLCIMTLITGPWLILLHRRAPGFLTSLMNDGLHHAASSTEQHSGPPGYYLLLIVGTFFPWSLFLITALTIAWKHRNLPQVRFALAALIGPWIFQELIRTKLPFYVLPTFPALAFLTADALVRCFRRQHDDLIRPVARIAAGTWAVAIMLLGLAPWLFASPPFRIGPLIMPDLHLGDQPLKIMAIISVVGLGFGVALFFLFIAGRIRSAAVTCGIGAMLLLGLVLVAYLPAAPFLRLSNRVAQSLVDHGATRPGEVLMAGYKEPGLAFYQGGTIREAAYDNYLRKALPQDWARWIVLPKTEWDKTPTQAQNTYEIVDALYGIDYAGSVEGTHFPTILILRRRD